MLQVSDVCAKYACCRDGFGCLSIYIPGGVSRVRQCRLYSEEGSPDLTKRRLVALASCQFDGDMSCGIMPFRMFRQLKLFEILQATVRLRTICPPQRMFLIRCQDNVWVALYTHVVLHPIHYIGCRWRLLFRPSRSKQDYAATTLCSSVTQVIRSGKFTSASNL